jgi:hypothetical protein
VKLAAAQEAHYSHSGTASSIARQSAFAGIAIVWLFNGSGEGSPPISLPPVLLLATLLLVLTLVLDLMQYVIATLVWSWFARRIETVQKHQPPEKQELPASPYLNWPSIGCFWGKVATLFAAYTMLALFLLPHVGFGGEI